MHKLYGDVPKEHQELVKELMELEGYFLGDSLVLGPAETARGLVCLSHDWYELGDEDKGSELLEKATKICPTYFNKEINEHIEEDELYKMLVESLTKQILLVAKGILEDRGIKK